MITAEQLRMIRGLPCRCFAVIVARSLYPEAKIDTIAAEIGVSPATVKRANRELRRRGVVFRVSRLSFEGRQ